MMRIQRSMITVAKTLDERCMSILMSEHKLKPLYVFPRYGLVILHFNVIQLDPAWILALVKLLAYQCLRGRFIG